MFKGLDDLKKKTLETAQETTAELGDRSDALQDDIASAGDRATTQAAELTRETTDRARRTAGKLSSRWSEPETRVEKKLMKELIWFICNDCHSELGPLELGKWKRFIKDAIVGGAGVLTGNPILILSVMLIILGVQFLGMGLLGEINIRTYFESQGLRIYHVKEVLPQ